ncbi:MAG: hypothetical protein U5L11_06490 [Arhodomonas sp.]|nr:hypothetical protein [Arhodomonas sp.]
MASWSSWTAGRWIPVPWATLVQEQPRVYRLEGQERLRFHLPAEDADPRIQQVAGLLATLGGGSSTGEGGS